MGWTSSRTTAPGSVQTRHQSPDVAVRLGPAIGAGKVQSADRSENGEHFGNLGTSHTPRQLRGRRTRMPYLTFGKENSATDGIQESIAKDRLAYLTAFFRDFYNLDLLMGKRISDEVVCDSWNVALTGRRGY